MKAYRLTQKFMRDMKENDTLKKELFDFLFFFFFSFLFSILTINFNKLISQLKQLIESL